MQKKLVSFWPIILLVLITFLLRLYKLEELFYFTYDESIPAFVSRRLILWHHIPLIGGATPFGFHLGPYFYWFYSAMLFFGNLNPIAWGIAASLISSVTTFLIYIVAKEFANKKIAIISATLWTFSYLSNIYDRHLWALFWGPLLSLLVLFFLNKITKGFHKFIIPLGFVLALGIHADPSNLIFVGLAIVTWIIYRLPLNTKTIIGLLITPLLLIPLIIFDLRHDFANTRPVLDFIKAGKNTPGFNPEYFSHNLLLLPKAFSRLIYKFGDNEITKQYSYCKDFVEEKFSAIPSILVLVSALCILYFIYWSLAKNQKPSWRLVSILVIFYFAGILLYGSVLKGDIFEHYITGLFPAFLLITALLLSHLPKKIWIFGLAVFVAANLYKLSVSQSSMGLSIKRQAIEYTMRAVGDKPFSLDSLSTCWKYNGYRYLFAVFGREPQKSYVDPNFSYLYGTTPVLENHPQTVVAFVVHDFKPETADFYKRYTLLKSHEISSTLFGNIEVIIMDNSSGWFD